MACQRETDKHSNLKQNYLNSTCFNWTTELLIINIIAKIFEQIQSIAVEQKEVQLSKQSLEINDFSKDKDGRYWSDM